VSTIITLLVQKLRGSPSSARIAASTAESSSTAPVDKFSAKWSYRTILALRVRLAEP
jgi:hypothetical protein